MATADSAAPSSSGPLPAPNPALRTRTATTLALGGISLLLVATESPWAAQVGATGLTFLSALFSLLRLEKKQPAGNPDLPAAHQESPPHAHADAQAESPLPPASETAADAYEWIEKLGEGQMGEVWRAKHRRLGRPCAVKIIHAEKDGTEHVRRFEREARVTASLHSPHIVQVFDFGLRSDGSFFYAMELLEGQDLQSLIDKHGPLSVEATLNILLQVCHGLEEAHQAGLVHRDLKPANLMLCRVGLEVDFVKIVDFGLAKDSSSEKQPSTKLTSDRTVLGTAAYLAPESLKGSAFVDAHADIYALGCIAFWLLTGELLFDAKTPMKMAKAHCIEPAPRVHDLKPEVPAELDALVAQCLSKEPSARPESALAVAMRLQALAAPLGAGRTLHGSGAVRLNE